jgi:hypothetical protein
MNRRKLVALTVSLVPGVTPFRCDTLRSGQCTALADYPSGDLIALRSLRNTEEVVMELLQVCLERIGWQGDVSNWQNKLDQALDRLQSRLSSEKNPLFLHATAFQIDCLKRICCLASTGNEAQTFLSALVLCDAFLPFAHWGEEGFQREKHDKLDQIAERYAGIYSLLCSSTKSIGVPALIQHLKGREYFKWAKIEANDSINFWLERMAKTL